MTTSLTSQRSAAVAMAAAAGLAIAGFTALGSIFDYPGILKEPTEHILSAFRESETGVRSWFLVLTIGAALLAPIAVVLGRIGGGRRGRWITGLGIAAATAQTIGLSRWVLLIPAISDRATNPAQAAAAHRNFEHLHTWLGVVLGESIGYALTAAFTVLVVKAAAGRIGTRLVGWLGYTAAALVATGVVIPLGITAASLTNFAGYIAWCVWLVAMAVALWRTRPEAPTHSKSGGITARAATQNRLPVSGPNPLVWLERSAALQVWTQVTEPDAGDGGFGRGARKLPRHAAVMGAVFGSDRSANVRLRGRSVGH